MSDVADDASREDLRTDQPLEDDAGGGENGDEALEAVTLMSAEEANGFAAWQPPSMEQVQAQTAKVMAQQEAAALQAAVQVSQAKLAPELDKIRQQAYEAGFAQGKADGAIEGKTEALAQESEHLQQLTQERLQWLEQLNEPFQQLNKAFCEDLGLLMQRIMEQVIGQELSQHPGKLANLIEQMIQLIPQNDRGQKQVQVFVSPTQHHLLSPLFGTFEGRVEWHMDEQLADENIRVESLPSIIEYHWPDALAQQVEQLVQRWVHDTKTSDDSSG